MTPIPRHHDTALGALDSDLYIKEVSDLHEQIAGLRSICDDLDGTIHTRDKRIEQLSRWGQVESERSRWMVHDMDMLKTEIKRLETLVKQQRLDLVALEAEVGHWKDLAEQQHLAGVAMRKWMPESCR